MVRQKGLLEPSRVCRRVSGRDPAREHRGGRLVLVRRLQPELIRLEFDVPAEGHERRRRSQPEERQAENQQWQRGRIRQTIESEATMPARDGETAELMGCPEAAE